ncbi:MAG: hydroxysqualene dehydroxylase HpnE [Rubrivivax sp.]
MNTASSPPAWRVAVVGAGWAGLAAAVRCTQAGHHVSLFDTTDVPGGRARSVPAATAAGATLDNGQHILIGAYTRCLDLMRSVGVDPATALKRLPLVLRHADGRGLQLGSGPPLWAFSWAVLRARGWGWRDKLALLRTATAWLLRGFRCAPDATVARLCKHLPAAVRQLLIDPLCVAALNTPAEAASGAVFLRVLRDALFSGRGSADLLLPQVGLGDLLPAPACTWLAQHGATLHWRRRVQQLQAPGTGQRGWRLDGEAFDAVVLACSAAEAARLTQAQQPAWAATAAAFSYEPIVTVYLQAQPAQAWPAPMLALQEGPNAPAQFAFDHGALGGPPGRYALVVSGAAPWVAQGLEATAQATLAQTAQLLPGAQVLRTLAEKRATFRCTPHLQRPPAAIAPGLWAAGDYVQGPYPATLEGAVRAGENAAAEISVCSQAFRDAK